MIFPGTIRDWLQVLEQNDLLNRVKGEASINQLAGTIAENYQKATLFERIQGYDMSLAANTFSNRKMMALALKTDEGNILTALEEKIQRRNKPVIVKDARCKEIIKLGDEVNPASFPIHLQHERGRVIR